ncbi:flavin reductase [Oceanobacillus piezotolerans]|uniref:Flavin reductase n=1 Tax=Oceanobacillus piezotolerans TaxID=2448030 RepID=A0A498D821_9BACI|nr:flavin reductase family protein [Oceanobacillus piezotolerans]RLL43938.1 flavin reductase [Oceanobacillus piezotolerans]
MDVREFRNAMGNFASGVTVITSKDENDNFVGLTVNAFSSLSLDPAQILFCIDKGSSSLPAIKKGNAFVVNILQEKQELVCLGFAKKGGNKFKDVPISLSDEGVPVLTDNLATIHCHVYEIYEGGDHLIVVGDVGDFSYDESKTPLLFYRGKLNPKFQETMA